MLLGLKSPVHVNVLGIFNAGRVFLMNLNHLRYFATVLKRGSFQRASEELHITQPALSNSMKKLEDLFDVPLLERTQQGVFPTAYGEALNEFSLTAVDAVNRAKLELDLMKRGSRGHVRIGAPGGMIDQVLPYIVSDLRSSKPEFTYDVEFGYLNRLLEKLVDGRVDFLLTTIWPDANITDVVKVDTITDLSLSIYGRAGHPLGDGRPVSLADLGGASWILPESRGMRDFVKRLFGEPHKGKMHQPIFSRHMPFIHACMEQMDLLSIIPDYVVANDVQKGKMVKVNYDHTRWELSAGVLYLRERTQTPAMMNFLKTARRVAKDRLSCLTT